MNVCSGPMQLATRLRYYCSFWCSLLSGVPGPSCGRCSTRCDGSAAATQGLIYLLRAYSNAPDEGARPSARKFGVPLGIGAADNVARHRASAWDRLYYESLG